MNNFEDDLTKIKVEVQEMNTKLAKEDLELEQIRQGLRGKTDVIQGQIVKKQVELAPWSEKISAAQSSLNVVQAEYTIILKRLSESKNGLEEAETKLQNLIDAKESTKIEIESHKEAKKTALDAIQDNKENIALFSKQEVTLRALVQTSRQKVDESKIVMQAAQTRGSVHKSLMQQSKSGKLKGICVKSVLYYSNYFKGTTW